jgi:hypothetical protein
LAKLSVKSVVATSGSFYGLEVVGLVLLDLDLLLIKDIFCLLLPKGLTYFTSISIFD